MIDYSPLWETMNRKNVTQYRLLKDGELGNRKFKGVNITICAISLKMVEWRFL